MWLGCNQLKNLKPRSQYYVHFTQKNHLVQSGIRTNKFVCLCQKLCVSGGHTDSYFKHWSNALYTIMISKLCKTSFVFGYIWAEWKWFWELFSLLSIYLLIPNVHELKIYFFIQYCKGWFLLVMFFLCLCHFFFNQMFW